MGWQNLNPDLSKRKSANGQFLAAQQRADERDAAHAQREPDKVPCLCGHGECSSNSLTKCCRACRDSIRWTGRVPPGLSDEAADAVAKIVHLIPRATNRAERHAQAELSSAQAEMPPQRGTAAAIREVVTATVGEPKAIKAEPVLPPDVNLDDPAQRKHLANCVLLKGMNYEAGVRTAYPKIRPIEAAIVAAHVQQDKSFQGDIQEAASQRGISDEDKQAFISILWKYASSTKPQDYQDRGTALRLLAKVFLPEGVKPETPQALPLQDLQAGLDRMGLDAATLKSVEAVPASSAISAFSDVEFDDEEEEDSED